VITQISFLLIKPRFDSLFPDDGDENMENKKSELAWQ
jgi:hypothetical protein